MKEVLKSKLEIMYKNHRDMDLYTGFLTENKYDKLKSEVEGLLPSLDLTDYPKFEKDTFADGIRQSNLVVFRNSNIGFTQTAGDESFKDLLPHPFNKKKFNDVIEEVLILFKTSNFANDYVETSKTLESSIKENLSKVISNQLTYNPRISVFYRVNTDKLEALQDKKTKQGKPVLTDTERKNMDVLIHALKNDCEELRYVYQDENLDVLEGVSFRKKHIPISKNAMVDKAGEIMRIISNTYDSMYKDIYDNDSDKLEALDESYGYGIKDLDSEESIDAYYSRLVMDLATTDDVNELNMLYGTTSSILLFSMNPDTIQFNQKLYLIFRIGQLSEKKIKTLFRYLIWQELEKGNTEYIFKLFETNIPTEYIISEQIPDFGFKRERVKQR